MRTQNPNRFQRALLPAGLLFFFIALNSSQPLHAQNLESFDRENAKAMLSAAKDDLMKNYYDPAMRGMDIEDRFKKAEASIKQATTRDQLVTIVAQTLLELDDSHTFFLPPARAAQVQYGWEMLMVGQHAYIKAVKPKSDAEATGLKVGDEILAVDGYRPARENVWKMYYRYYALAPARSIRLVVQSPGDTQTRELNVPAKIVRTANVTDWSKLFMQYLHEEGDLAHDRFYVEGKDLMVWQMPTFSVSPDHIDEIMGRAKNFKSLIIDIRGNGGGYLVSLERLVGYFFDHDVKIADQKSRKEMKPSLAKTRGSSMFSGQLFILVDSGSASASELFSRVIQMEKRGTLIGDRTAGAVMTARYFDHQSGVGNVLYFGNSVTVADSIMTDGKSLEKTGVTPDVVLLPTGADLAAKRDPVLAHAAKLAGVNLDAEKAGSLFPKEWRGQ